MRTSLTLLAAGAILMACSSNDATGPDPRNCTAGTIGDNDTKTGHLGDASCHIYDWEYLADSTYSVSYDVRLEQGKGYMFNLQRDTVTKNWDAVLELVGKDANTGDEQLLQISDDEGPMNFSQMHFVAPESGTYSLRVMGYDARGHCELRPAIAPLRSAARAHHGHAAADRILARASAIACSRSRTSPNDSTYYQMFSIVIGPNQTKTIIRFIRRVQSGLPDLRTRLGRRL